MNKAFLLAIPLALFAAENIKPDDRPRIVAPTRLVGDGSGPAPRSRVALVQANRIVRLPQKLPYQQQLRKFMATLKEEDFEPVYKDLTVVKFAGDPDYRLRLWILSLQPPSVGRKRNYSSVKIKSSQFTLDAIEGEQDILRPPAHPEPLVDLAGWDYPGNPHFGSKALRLRAFVLAALDMIMLENLLETAESTAKPNQNQLALAINRLAYVYPGLRDVIPAEVSDAYLTGLKRLVRRALEHGPAAIAPKTQGMYTAAAPALFLSAKILKDDDITKQAEAYARTLFTDERFFRPAGYFPSGGTLDSFNGISTYYAVWGAIASESPFARQAIARVYDLRSHLTLPDPDGTLLGPSHMASLTSAESAHEQWNWPMRTWAAALVADEAACLTKLPDEAELQKAAALVVAEINTQLHELSWTPKGLDPAPWKLQAAGTLVNFAYQHYPKDYHARRVALEERNRLARLPVLRDQSYVRTFPDEFVVAKTDRHASIVHVGPIAEPGNPKSAYGFGGGALSAFWTPGTGSVILGRGIGAYSPQYKKSLDEWRSLPSHAVTGITSDGIILTSAHIVTPETSIKSAAESYTVTVHGRLPTFRHAAGTKLARKIDYARTFDSSPGGVRVTTTIKTDGNDKLAELYETLPIFLREQGSQAKLAPTTIEVGAPGTWMPARDSFADGTRYVRLTRFGASVLITFDRPCRVKLAPVWADTYQTRAACRNLLIDMLDNDARTISYRIEAATK